MLAFLLLLLLATCPGKPTPPPPSPSAFLPQQTNAPNQQPTPRDRAELERLVFLESNRAREREGLPPLRSDAILAKIAREHSEDMLRRRYFQHQTPEGIPPDQRIHRGHRTLFGTTGENLWSGSGYAFRDLLGLARGILEDWMASPGHRENLLRSEFTHLGVGIATAAGGQIRVTQNFAAVRAYLRHPFPPHLSPDTDFQLSMQDLELPGDSVVAPVSIAWQRDAAGTGDLLPLGSLRTPTLPGSYQLHLAFPEAAARRFLLIPGPRVKIR